MSEKAAKIITVENVHVSIWKNEGGPTGIYHTASFSKSYEVDGETHYTTSFGGFDLSRLVTAAGMAITWMWTENRKRNRKNTGSRKSRSSQGNGEQKPPPPPPDQM